MTGRVIIGFGNSMGKLDSVIMEEKYQVIERMGSKIRATPPMIRPIQTNHLDLDHLKTMIGQRRNQALLNSFLNIDNEEDGGNLYQLQDEARRKVKGIKDELNTMKVVQVNLKMHKFMSRTSSREEDAEDYLKQFKDVDLAVEKFKERQNIIRDFANKQKISNKQAEDILKANGYNAQLFD